MATATRTRTGRRRTHPALPVTYVAAGLLGALGGARPTGLDLVDPLLLGLVGAGVAACGVRARTFALYAAAGAAVLCQRDLLPAVVGMAGLGAVVARSFVRGRTIMGAVGGGMAWACAVGVPMGSPARPLAIPLLAIAVMGWSAQRYGSRSFRRRFRRVVLGAGAFAAIGAVAGLLAVAGARNSVARGADLLDQGLQQAREGDTEAATATLRNARDALRTSRTSLDAAWARPAWLVPGVSQNLRALRSIVYEVDGLAGVAITTAEDADVQQLGPRDGQIDLVAIAAVEHPLAGALDRLRAARSELAEVADSALLPPIRSRLEEVQEELDDALPDAELALDGVRLAPALFGADGDTTYLVLFTTPVESRATSGFPGNYAEVTFASGRFDMTEFGRISELNDALGPEGVELAGSEEYLARYSPFSPGREWRNITLSPDFPTVARVAAQLYPQSGGREIDGVMTVDPYALAALMEFTGPVTVPGLAEPIRPGNAADFLLREQYITLPDVPDRTDALEILAETTFDRLSAADLPGPRALGRTFGPIVAQGHLQVFHLAERAAPFLDGIGISGRFPTVEGDLLAVTTSNAAGNKIDLFARRTIRYDVSWDPSTGRIEATLTLTLANDAPDTGLPNYLIGNVLGLRPGDVDMPAGWNNSFVSIYTPLALQEATLDGEPVSLGRNVEVGVGALSTFVAVPPRGQRTLVVQLAGTVAGDEYVLDILGQPMANPDQATVSITVAGGGRLDTTGPVTADGGGVAEGDFELVETRRITAGR